MTHCPRCRTACAGDAYCSWCGLALAPTVDPPTAALRLPAPASAPSPPPPQQPGTITAVRALLGISAAGFGCAVLMGVAGSVAASSFSSTVARSVLDDGTSTTLRTLATAMGVLAVVSAVLAGLEVWAIGAVGARRRSARTVVTLVEVADLVIGVVFVGVVGVEAVAPIVMSLPFGVTLLVLLWVPESSRRWFDEAPAPAPTSRPARAARAAADDARTEVLVLPVPRSAPARRPLEPRR